MTLARAATAVALSTVVGTVLALVAPELVAPGRLLARTPVAEAA
jgi:hypothetical protein